ncbi:MAG: response regulator [Deltaproteobacteria bacterium]|nr:response regulator [Deltaproteobacteria bacterium]MCW5801043.1 response regulator [Deltaproteobacteria bacterium]
MSGHEEMRRSGEASSADEKRRDGREAVTLFVEYEGADDLIGDFTENLSTGGTFVATNRELPTGTRVQLVLSFPGLLEPIAIEGTVRWTRVDGLEGDAGAGIEFEPGPGRDTLASVIERIRARDPRMVSRLFRVLVVEDNRHVAALIQEGLRGSTRRDFGGGISFVFRNAEDGRAAVEILRREPFDALIIDVYLPVLDGPKVIAHARTELGLEALPIIAVSAGGDAARRSALEAGANIFLDKPMRLRQVIDTIQRLLHV